MTRMKTEGLVVLTGANKGLGKEVVRQLAGKGMIVYLGSRDIERGEADLAKEKLAVTVVEFNITDLSVMRVAAQIANKHGRLDVLINNARTHTERSLPRSPGQGSAPSEPAQPRSP
jgi:NAD(P)-dependent dehydrogenase (short-subunit alcohol dehydrogenase family)